MPALEGRPTAIGGIIPLSRSAMPRRLLYALALVMLAVAATARLPAQVVAVGRGGGPPAPAIEIGDGTGAISGIVVDGVTGTPLPGVVVSISGSAPLPAPAGRAATSTRVTTTGTGMTEIRTGPPTRSVSGFAQITDAQGRFVFTHLPPAGYLLNATKFGYFDGGYGRRTIGGTPRRITIADGQWFRDARIELVRPSALSGTVVDEAGEPLVGVHVRACADIFVAGVRHIASGPTVQTDDRGVYRIGSLPEGRYIVSVLSVQHAVPADLSIFELSGTTPQAVAAAEATGRTPPLRRDPAIALDPAHRLIVGPYPPPPPLSTTGRPQAYPLTFYPSARTLPEAEAITLGPGEDRNAVDLQLRPVPTVRVSGRLDGPPDALGGLLLRLMPAGSEHLGRGNEAATAVAAGDGSFTFLNVPDGAYVLIASRSIAEYRYRPPFTVGSDPPGAPGVRTAGMSSSAAFSGPSGTMFTSYDAQGDAGVHGRMRVDVDGREVTDLVVPLQRGVTMSGRIVAEFETPPGMPPGLRLGFLRAEPANGDPTLGQPRMRRTATDPGDAFTIEGLRPGQYFLRTSRTVKSIVWDGRDYTSTPFDASTGSDITGIVVTITDEAGRITGTVRDQTGAAADDAAVIYFPAERELWTNFGTQPPRMRATTASTAGIFNVTGVPAGDYLLIAVHGDQIDAWKNPAFLDAAARLATRVSVDWNETKTLDLVRQQVK